jgi:2',3'-cyclic-nucleotide 2'-phosphodiesterase/3'-nucleotidase
MDRSALQSDASAEPCRLRILATSDLHMQLTAYNFITDTDAQTNGFAGIATLIEQARAEAHSQSAGCVLFDNGDLLQGSPMSDWLATQPVTAQHPVIACLNGLKYDAMGVGNHDLDYGVPYLRDVAAKLRLPMIASNLTARDISPLTPAALIPCAIPTPQNAPAQHLKIGVLSVLPQQTSLWNHHMLEGVATVQPAVDSLTAAIPALRAQGADLIVVLAHMGLEKNTDEDDTALPLAKIPGIDAMIAGHTHRRFPGYDHASAEGVDIEHSTVAQVPAAMPGHAGSDLAVLDLELAKDGAGKWHVTHHTCALRQNTPQTRPAQMVLAATQTAQQAVRSHLSGVAGQARQDLQNFFALVQPTPICELTAHAKARIAQADLCGMAEAKLPMIVATSAHTAGGRDGPQNFLHIPKGPILRRHLSGLNPFDNQIWAIRESGADVLKRLEQAATIFRQLSRDAPAQDLHNPTVPIYNFDTYFGLRYDIDPLQPPGQRIKNLRHGDAPVRPDQTFVIVTNQFRAAGGGGYAQLPAERVILRSNQRLEIGLIDVLANPEDSNWQHPAWRITPSSPVSATIETSPDALQHLHQIAHLSPHVGPTTAEGFVQLRVTF